MCCCKLLSSLNVDFVLNPAFLLDKMNETICRLCLQTITNDNYQAVEESLLKSLKLDLKICKENVMCIECADSLQVLSNFTAGSVYKRDVTLPLSGLENGLKSESESVQTTSNPKSLMETRIKCSFCTKTRKREDLVSLRVLKENEFLLEQYILQTNLKNTEEFLTCDTCLEALEGVLRVILKCLEVEEKISKYIELKGTDDEGQVKLKEVQQFIFRPIIKSEVESFSVNKLEQICDQVQEEYTTMTKTEIKDEKELINTELIIKTEDVSGCDITDIKSEESDRDRFQEPVDENETPSNPLHLSVVVSETKKFRDRVNQHLFTHNNPSEIEIFKCELCSHETRHKTCLRQHLLIHKSPSDLKMYKCGLCSYETKRKSSMKQHLLVHKSPSEINMFKCESCSYETRHKLSLQNHVLIHKSPSEIKMFKCALCAYEAKRKCTLKDHLLTHRSPLEIKMFKCEICPYEANSKTYLRRHLLVHKKMLKCRLCPYETNNKSTLKVHLSTHQSPVIKMFKCALCSHETKYKSALKAHVLIHKSPSETKMFKCKICSYETNINIYLQRHSLIHKRPSERKMFKCALCSYETKTKLYLVRHLSIHRNPPKVKIFKCDTCSYKTKTKKCLKIHSLIHKSPSEVKMFKCELCSFESKYRSTLKPHLLIHKRDKNV